MRVSHSSLSPLAHAAPHAQPPWLHSELYELHGIEHLRLQVPDMSPVSAEQVEKGVEFIARMRRQHPGKQVLVHCKCGMGRSACVAVAYLAMEGDGDAERVAAEVQKKRVEVHRGVAKYPGLVKVLAKHHPAKQQ